MDASENINNWGVHPSSLEKHIGSFIGKPLVLTEEFSHPMPPEHDRVADTYYDNDNNPHNTVQVNDIVEHWLAYQETYRIGNIIDITQKNGIYYAIIEVTDPKAQEAFRNNDVPIFVSPAIAQLNPHEDPANITLWTGIHLALVSNPAYTIKKAFVTSQCHESGDNKHDNGRCLLQLRQAAVTASRNNSNKPLFCCGFCRTKALARYASIVQQYPEKSQNVLSGDDFINSSIEFSESPNKVSSMSESTAEEESNNNNNNTTTNNNNNNNAEVEPHQQQQQQVQEKPVTNKLSQVVKDVNPSQNPHHGRNINPETGQPYAGSSSLTADEIGVKVAGMEECVQIFTQNGVTPDQSVQICKLAAKALMENQQGQDQPGGGGARRTPSGNGPGIGGQFGSQIADYEKEIAKQEVKIGQLVEELKQYKKGDKTDAQRIAELEDTVSNLNRNLKEKELEAYLVTKIADTELRNKKIKRFADLNMTIEDLKDIYDSPSSTDPKIAKSRTAEVTERFVNSPITPKVKLQVASTQQDTNSQVTEIRERNNRISSLLSKKEFK